MAEERKKEINSNIVKFICVGFIKLKNNKIIITYIKIYIIIYKLIYYVVLHRQIYIIILKNIIFFVTNIIYPL